MAEFVPHRQVIDQQNTLYVDEANGKVLVKIETKKLDQLTKMLEELVDSDLPTVTFSIASNQDYLLTVFKWDDDLVRYVVSTVK